jgi:hypothetical protein
MQSASSRGARLFVISWGNRQPTCFSFTWRQSHGTQAAKERERARVVGGSRSFHQYLRLHTEIYQGGWKCVLVTRFDSPIIRVTYYPLQAFHALVLSNWIFFFHFFISAVCGIRAFLFFPHKKCLVDWPWEQGGQMTGVRNFSWAWVSLLGC